MDLGRPGPAEQAFLKAIELDGSNLVAMRGLASLAREKGDEAGARFWFQRISGLEPEVTPAAEPLPPTEEVWWTPGESVESADETEDASEAWWFEDPAEAGSADDGDLLTRTMAELYEKQGLIAEAIAIYTELLEDRPDDAELKAAVERAESLLATAPEEHTSEPPESEPLDTPAETPAAAPTVSHSGTSGRSEVFLDWLRSLNA